MSTTGSVKPHRGTIHPQAEKPTSAMSDCRRCWGRTTLKRGVSGTQGGAIRASHRAILKNTRDARSRQHRGGQGRSFTTADSRACRHVGSILVELNRFQEGGARNGHHRDWHAGEGSFGATRTGHSRAAVTAA